jgi:hypothetical protein
MNARKRHLRGALNSIEFPLELTRKTEVNQSMKYICSSKFKAIGIAVATAVAVATATPGSATPMVSDTTGGMTDTTGPVVSDTTGGAPEPMVQGGNSGTSLTHPKPQPAVVSDTTGGAPEPMVQGGNSGTSLTHPKPQPAMVSDTTGGMTDTTGPVTDTTGGGHESRNNAHNGNKGHGRHVHPGKLADCKAMLARLNTLPKGSSQYNKTVVQLRVLARQLGSSKTYQPSRNGW